MHQLETWHTIHNTHTINKGDSNPVIKTCPLSYFVFRNFYEGGGGEVYFDPGFFFRMPEPVFLFFVFAWYGPGFFSVRIMRIKQTQRALIVTWRWIQDLVNVLFCKMGYKN